MLVLCLLLARAVTQLFAPLAVGVRILLDFRVLSVRAGTSCSTGWAHVVLHLKIRLHRLPEACHILLLCCVLARLLWRSRVHGSRIAVGLLILVRGHVVQGVPGWGRRRGRGFGASVAQASIDSQRLRALDATAHILTGPVVRTALTIRHDARCTSRWSRKCVGSIQIRPPWSRVRYYRVRWLTHRGWHLAAHGVMVVESRWMRTGTTK